MSHWTNKSVLVDDIIQLISSSSSGHAAGPFGMSFDHFKIVVNAVPEIREDLADFFSDEVLCTKKLPHAHCSSGLVALNKPNGGVRPIAVGETISRILQLCVLEESEISLLNSLDLFNLQLKFLMVLRVLL
ncbi:hypothetical protein GEMRC1_003362 [Eukaryota sp. GEM-RC1]